MPNTSSNKGRYVKLMNVLCNKAACLLCVLLVLLYAGALPMVYASVFCLSWACRWLILSSYCLLSMWGLYKVITNLLKLFQPDFLEKEGFCCNKMLAVRYPLVVINGRAVTKCRCQKTWISEDKILYQFPFLICSLHDLHEGNAYVGNHICTCLPTCMLQLENHFMHMDEIW